MTPHASLERRVEGVSRFILIVLLASVVPAPQGAPVVPIPPVAAISWGGGQAVRQAFPGASERWAPSLVQTGAPQATGEIGTALVGGWATYYATCPDCAAAGPVLREALGPGWRGELVEVQSDHGAVTLRLTDWCACGERKGKPTFIDVSIEAFNALSPYPAGSSKDPGVIPVWIELDPPEHEADRRMRVEDGGPSPTLPATDTSREDAR